MDSPEPGKGRMSRREFIKAGLLSGGATAVAATIGPGHDHAAHDHASLLRQEPTPPAPATEQDDPAGHDHGGFGTVGEVDAQRNGFDPHAILQDWDFGQVSTLSGGQTLREYSIVAVDKEFEIAPGVFFPGWVYNGRVPGPTLRCVEGDHIRIEFFNGGSHPHTIHFHGIHAASMDGVPGVGAGMIEPGGKTIYEFDAFPFGCHLYHCHATPLKRHIHKGLYGAFIIDPDPARHTGEDRRVALSRNHLAVENQSVNEMVMVMNAFDTNFDGENEVYAANTVAFAYMNKPIAIRRDQRQRLYLVNITEFDPINSFHLHANFFDYYDHGTTLSPTLRTVDTIMQCQAQRGILEFDFKGFEPGRYMFHAHQSEFAELGWMGFFEVQA
jgi:FtsP/CotA-like multicopper oxidase with cupredoxin domain